MVFSEGIMRRSILLIIECLLIIFVIVVLLGSASAWDGRPSDCPRRAWCGCYLSYKLFGYNQIYLWRARNWLALGRRVTRPYPGVVAIYARGRGGHVGLVTGVTRNGIILLSGNDGGAVRERERSTRGIIGYRSI